MRYKRLPLLLCPGKKFFVLGLGFSWGGDVTSGVSVFAQVFCQN